MKDYLYLHSRVIHENHSRTRSEFIKKKKEKKNTQFTVEHSKHRSGTRNRRGVKLYANRGAKDTFSTWMFDGLQTISPDRSCTGCTGVHPRSTRDTAERKCRRMHQRKHASTF